MNLRKKNHSNKAISHENEMEKHQNTHREHIIYSQT